MEIHGPGIYHIYNRGNNRHRIFFNEENYHYFLQKCHRYLKPVSEVFAWCLMPNHFHFLIEVTEKSMVPVKSGNIFMPAITNAIRLLQSSYAKGINVQQKRTGNLFQQKTKAKLVNAEENDYTPTAFFYIHQNPVKAGLVLQAADWPYSSFREYVNTGRSPLCNKEKYLSLLRLSVHHLQKEITREISEEEAVRLIY